MYKQAFTDAIDLTTQLGYRRYTHVIYIDAIAMADQIILANPAPFAPEFTAEGCRQLDLLAKLLKHQLRARARRFAGNVRIEDKPGYSHPYPFDAKDERGRTIVRSGDRYHAIIFGDRA